MYPEPGKRGGGGERKWENLRHTLSLSLLQYSYCENSDFGTYRFEVKQKSDGRSFMQDFCCGGSGLGEVARGKNCLDALS